MQIDEKQLQQRVLLLQINDSLFPIGSYAHSFGLETYIQRGIVKDTETAQAYIRSRLRLNFAYTDLLTARLSWEAADRGEFEKTQELEEILEASRVPFELREASKKLGSRFIKTLSHLHGGWEGERWSTFLALVKGKACSQPVAYGVCTACAGITEQEAMLHFLYSQASQMTTNCVKAIPISQTDGQKILSGLWKEYADILRNILSCPEEMLCMSTPAFDLRSMEHEELYSRLYMS